ncbi:hypothetical protein [Amycolatopsis sp. SID8362]|nr:hypothetical protein [Amycolatopsis sp. SID8362]
MDQEADSVADASEQPTTIDQMSPEDWARAKELREQFDAQRGAR